MKRLTTSDPRFEMPRLMLTALIFMVATILNAQEKPSVNLRQAIDHALENNQLLKIRDHQIDEKQYKLSESRLKALPSLIANSTWQYNQNLGELTIAQGEFGNLPLSPQMIIPLPASDLSFPLSKHKTFNAGITLYQPLTQLGKIKAGADVSKTELQISETEKGKSVLQIRTAVEKLFYGILITTKQIEEAEARFRLAGLKIRDAESALKSGKTIETTIAGLLAAQADEEQKLVLYRNQEEDVMADFCLVTGLTSGQFRIEPFDGAAFNDSVAMIPLEPVTGNTDLQLAQLTQTKAEQGVKAAQWTYLPDLGLIAGYTYQKGNKIFPEKNPFVGATLKWNVQDLLLNRQLVNQRRSQLHQSQEQLALAEKQVVADVEKARRKMSHARALVHVATKAVSYRREELNVQQNKHSTGLTTETEVWNVKAQLAKSEADLLAAQLNFRLAVTELQVLKGE